MEQASSDSSAVALALRLSTQWRFWNVVLSLSFFSWSTASLFVEVGSRGALPIVITQVPVLGLIWYCDFWSGWLGPLIPGGLNTKSIDRSSPAWLIAGAGWLILVSVFALGGS